MSERALRRGHGMRTGLEDAPFLPDGRPAADNAELVRAASALIARLGDGRPRVAGGDALRSRSGGFERPPNEVVRGGPADPHGHFA